MLKKKPVLLLIFDGWGMREASRGNAIAHAHTPHWDALLKAYPHTLLNTSGEKVGLPHGQMGNSEVGHLTMGAGRVIHQELTAIHHAIKEKAFFQAPVLINAFLKAKQASRTVHILGLLSPGGVHSHEDHLFACLEIARQQKMQQVVVHVFLDGRDTPPKSALASLQKLENTLRLTGATLGSIAGRFYAMDRDARWKRTQAAFNAIVHGKATHYASHALEALEQAYHRGETDEFVTPTCITSPHAKPITFQTGDSVIFMNFRADRARQLSEALTNPQFTGFTREPFTCVDNFITLTEYDSALPAQVVYPPRVHHNTLAEYLQKKQCTQLHIAETEKYAHVTFFFNGGRELPYEGETRILIPSPLVTTYDQAPCMSAATLTQKLIDNILSQQFDFIVCNYANADMVGHTGNFEATVKAIECLDQSLGQILDALKITHGEMLLTADHGNAEYMIDLQTEQPHTAHTTSLVPLVYYGEKKEFHFHKEGTLADIAPTLLTIMGLAQPKEMTGSSLMDTLP